MAQRKDLPAKTRERVLGEFNHLCAICGNPRPQIHHIDHNPSNDDEQNLIPLCPNHHLIDAHSPTQKIDPLKLNLFRKHKDPIILLSQFDPLFRRMRFLLTTDHDSYRVISQSNDLIDFVSYLKMGDYYSKKLRNYIGWNESKKPAGRSRESLLREALSNKNTAEHDHAERVAKKKDEAIDLIVELIRFQNWKFTNPYQNF